MTTETWRVVTEGGAVREVELTRSHMVGSPWVPNEDGLSGAQNPRIAVAAYAGNRAWSVVEVRGPGELTTGERVAAMRERCAAVASQVGVEVAAGAVEAADAPAVIFGRTRALPLEVPRG